MARFAETKKKILSIDEAKEMSGRHREKGASVGLTNGCFDILHCGHLSLLERARSMCDILIVGVNDDQSVQLLKGPSRPVNPAMDRARLVAGLECVTAVVIFSGRTADALITEILPSCYFKGGDYTRDNLPEYDTVQRLGVRPVFLDLEDGQSTTATIQRILSAYL
jgi:D-beta-D-heptose 7-phosphate kinase/D-beta-D-heptose 1-phosphate adenosyltransferase